MTRSAVCWTGRTRPRGTPCWIGPRTFSVPTLDPGAVARRVDASWCALIEGWSVAGGLADLPAHAMAWACRFMLDDLADRYGADELAAVSDAVGDAERRVGCDE
jgi:hypothetical protein